MQGETKVTAKSTLWKLTAQGFPPEAHRDNRTTGYLSLVSASQFLTMLFLPDAPWTRRDNGL